MNPSNDPPVERFIDALEGNGLPALRIAMRYMMRGVGVYQPRPRIVGVDAIHVICIREFGKTLSPREAKLSFELKWNNKHGRLDIQKKFEKPPRHLRTEHEFHDWYLKFWMEQAVRLSAHDDSTGTYEVMFTGTAGVWSAVFTVSCSSLSNQPVTILKQDVDAID